MSNIEEELFKCFAETLPVVCNKDYKTILDTMCKLVKEQGENIVNELCENKKYVCEGRENVICTICKLREINICNMPCGHTLCCVCAKQLQVYKVEKCHVCRDEVCSKMQIFI